MATIVFVAGHPAESGPNTGWLSQACSSLKIAEGSTYFDNVGSALADVLVNTPYQDYNYKTSRGGHGAPTAYAAGRCQDHITREECRQCLKLISEGIWNSCGNAIGAREQLVDCSLHYEQYYFD